MMRVLVALLLYCLITAGLTYPLVLHLASAFPHDHGDPALNTWILWWNARAVPFTSAWWNAPAFYPVPGVMSFSENLLGLSLIATPIQQMGGSPLFAYNIVFLLTFPLCAIAAFALTLEITKRRDAAFIGGLLFGFAPYRMAHLPHIQVLAAFAMPLALLGLHRYLRDSRPRWLMLFGAGWLLQGLSNGYYLLFFGVLVAMWILWFVPPASSPKRFGAIVAASCLVAVPLLPLLLHYKAIHERFEFTRDFGTIRHYGADALGLLNAEPSLALWGWLRIHRGLEGEIFPGLTIVLLLIVGGLFLRGAGTLPDVRSQSAHKWRLARLVFMTLLIVSGLVTLVAWSGGSWGVRQFGIPFSIGNPVKPLTWGILFGILLLLTSTPVRNAYSRQSVLGFYAVAAFVMWLFCLGPAPTLLGEPLMYRGPYALLIDLPGFSSLRVPARFWMMSVLCLSVVGAMILDRLGTRLPHARLTLAVAVAIGALADAWIWKFPLAPVPDVWTTEVCATPPGSDGAVMELPVGDIVADVGAMYRSISHGRPTVNGYSGYFPPHYPVLRLGLSLRDPDVLTQLAAQGVTHIAVNSGEDPSGDWDGYVRSHPGVRQLCHEGQRSLYRIAVSPSAATPVATPLSMARIHANINSGAVTTMIDQDRGTRWQSGPQTELATVEIDLGAVRTVGGIDLLLGGFVKDFPRGLLIEASEDGQSWRELWRGGSAGLAVVGALESPRDVPLKYRFAATRARFLRMRLTATDTTYHWSITELRVVGP
jgi:F5/8 type C domain